jgi:UDP-N-acetylmuramate: L-alanyl-gamma-D-glutamyl-meso-diaminopimelate ligase
MFPGRNGWRRTSCGPLGAGRGGNPRQDHDHFAAGLDTGRGRAEPGFLVGGVPQGFGVSARLTDSPFFVIEADEYDTAFCDKRSKFVHYQPRTAILNNLEFDHADIFADLAAIETQFHHLVRTLPGNGLIVANAGRRCAEARSGTRLLDAGRMVQRRGGLAGGRADAAGGFAVSLAGKDQGRVANFALAGAP